MKTLPPTLRDDTRYLKFEVHSEENVELGELVDAVWSASLDFMGSKGSSKANFWVISNQFDKEKQQGIIRVNRETEENFRAALTQIDKIGDNKGFIETKKVSGAIKNLKN